MVRKRTLSKLRTKAFDRSWHLSRTPAQVDLTELEFAIMRTNEAFGRWQAECLANVSDFSANGPEDVLLHLIRMNERPKSIKDLAQLTNRTDIPNLQYSLRKLIKAGLVVRRGSGRTGVTYSVTSNGRKTTDDYAEVRKILLVAAIKSFPKLPQKLADATRTLEVLTALYEQASRDAATHRRTRRY
jgi:predicted MarR family transcription regulator